MLSPIPELDGETERQSEAIVASDRKELGPTSALDRRNGSDRVDEESEQSFPASDPPSGSGLSL